ncbi:MAG: ABC transporter substrate-binding protein [Halopseudomonas sp.]
MVLAVIFQHSPLILVAREYSSTQGIHDIVDKRVMLEPQSDEIFAYLKQEGAPADRLQLLEHSFDPQDLIDGNIDAMSAYATNERFF